MEQAAADFSDATEHHPGSISSHARGRYYLARNDLAQAREWLARANENNQGTAQSHNDAGVALMRQSCAAHGQPESGEEVELLARALEAFNQALALAPNLPEAVFNRALLFEQMLLPHRAAEEWQAYLKFDAQSPWAEEARRNAARLAQAQAQTKPEAPAALAAALLQAQQQGDEPQAWAAISRQRNRTGSVAVGALIDQYLAAWARGDEAAARSLSAALQAAGATEFNRCGDRFHSDLAAFYLRAAPRWWRELIRARAHLVAGTNQLDDSQFEVASATLRKAASLFARAGDEVETLLTELLLLRCQRKQQEIAGRMQAYAQYARVCARRQYKWLSAQIVTAQAQLEDGRANYSNVIALGKRGLALSTEVSDTSTSTTFLLQMAESHFNLGDYIEALALNYRGLKLIAPETAAANPYPSWGAYLSIGTPLTLLEHRATAIAYVQESLRQAQQAKLQWQVCRSYLSLGLSYGAQEKEQALNNTRLAYEAAENIRSKTSRTEALALTLLEQGRLHYQLGEPAAALDSFDRALALYHGLNAQEAFEYVAHKGRLLALSAQGRRDLPEDELALTLDLFEKYRRKIREERNRNIFFDQEQHIYDIATVFYYAHKKDAPKAFELMESSRARTLLDLVSAAPGTANEIAAVDQEVRRVTAPLSLSSIQARMPQDAQLIEYAVLKDRLLIWLVRPGQPLVVEERAIGEEQLKKEVLRYLKWLTAPPQQGQTEMPAAMPAEMLAAGQRLYAELIGPVVAQLDPQRPLCLVPDKALNLLPFAALIAPATKRFLLEDFALLYAPSATMFVLCSEGAKAKEKLKTERALVIGDPTYDRTLFPNERLPASRPEAQAIAADYPGSLPLIGPQATKLRVEQELGRFDLLHFSLHCLVNPNAPMHSQLLLARPESSNADSEANVGAAAASVLQAYEIYRLNLARARLVVLAACQSGVERYYGGEGMIGISRPFLAKKIPLVVASLWSVDSPATSALMIDFHKGRAAQHLPTVAALRQAQLGLLHGAQSERQHPYYWAAFVTLGGQARF